MTVDKTYRENIFRNSNMYTTMIQSWRITSDSNFNVLL